MSILDLPSQVFQCILLDWISLPDLIRFDQAGAKCKTGNALEMQTLYGGHHCSFSDQCRLRRIEQLESLLLWMQSRKVYFNEIYLQTNLIVPWGNVFKHTGNTVKSLTIAHSCVYTNALESTLIHCNALCELTLHYCCVSRELLYSTLVNNAASLRKLHLHNGNLTNDNAHLTLPMLQIADLKLTSGFDSLVLPLLSKCSQLSDLHLVQTAVDNKIGECVAASCRELSTFRLHRMTLNSLFLCTILAKCVNIKHLEIHVCGRTFSDGLGQLLSTLPHLHTLLMDAWTNDLLVRVGVHKLVVLQTVEIDAYVFDMVTVQGFRSFAVGCPNLSALDLQTLHVEGTEEPTTVLEFCPNLRYLAVSNYLKGMEIAILRSAAVNCPLLHTLNLTRASHASAEVIDEVVSACTQLTKLILSYRCDYRISNPLISARVSIMTVLI